jgi:hypothetical protein
MRVVWLCLHLTGRNRLVAAAEGAPQPVHVHVAPALGTSGPEATGRVAKHRPPQDLPVTQDDTCTGGLGRITRDPERHCLIVAQRAQARAHTTGQAGLAPAVAPCHGRGSPATSDAAPGR